MCMFNISSVLTVLLCFLWRSAVCVVLLFLIYLVELLMNV